VPYRLGTGQGVENSPGSFSFASHGRTLPILFPLVSTNARLPFGSRGDAAWFTRSCGRLKYSVIAIAMG
jgi:hypothetical protein